jgi:serine/threonine protein phosphatase PrpC
MKAQAICNHLVNEANDRGGLDNITVVIARHL